MQGYAITNPKLSIRLQCPQGHWVFKNGINVDKLYKTTGIRMMSSQIVFQNNDEREVERRCSLNMWMPMNFTYRLNEPQWELMKKCKNQKCLECK